MNRPVLPSGRYLTITIDVHPDYGGQTRALLMRNRIFAAEGADADVLTVGAIPDLDWRRETLRERGLLTGGVDLLNIYEHYRDTDWPGEEPTDREPADLGAHLVREAQSPDGSLWRRTYKLNEGRTVHDYVRPDGSTYLRMPEFTYRDPDTWPDDILKISRKGFVVGRYRSPAGWYRRWLRDLSGNDRSLVFVDSRFMVPLVAPMKAPNIHLVYLMHNIHLGGERRWDSPTGETYQRVIELADSFDAFVTLTERQGEDIAQLRGRTSNMFVVPNPVDLPAEPDPPIPRDPRQVTVVARVEGQKRLSHAVRAFEQVLAQVPEARMDIYGRGSRTAGIQKVIDQHGLSDAVTMKGHDPHAREALWRSSAFLMTSMFEGYPLSTLESMSHGCPVVSYDIKYGPREQITDGEDGFLVPDGDTRAAADRVVQLLRDPELVRRMSAAARQKAAAHGYERFLGDWIRVLESALENRSSRTRISRADLEVHRLTVGRHAGPGRVGPRRRVRLEAALRVEGHGELSSAVVTLAAVHERTGLVVDLPVSVRRRGPEFRLSSTVPLSLLYPPQAQSQDRCRLRVRLTWANSSWETTVKRAASAPPGLEVGYGSSDEWTLTRR